MTPTQHRRTRGLPAFQRWSCSSFLLRSPVRCYVYGFRCAEVQNSTYILIGLLPVGVRHEWRSGESKEGKGEGTTRATAGCVACSCTKHGRLISALHQWRSFKLCMNYFVQPHQCVLVTTLIALRRLRANSSRSRWLAVHVGRSSPRPRQLSVQSSLERPLANTQPPDRSLLASM